MRLDTALLRTDRDNGPRAVPNDPLEDLLGSCPAIVAIREQIRRVLRQLDGHRLPPVLIHGETGTGKGLIARIIHRASPRRDGPFVDLNCAAIPETLLEAELFGFERGAFTGARHSKRGLFQSAHGGTLFLDEVGCLPEAPQVKLLKAVEERAVRRLGSIRPEPVETWIISATNADLPGAIHAGRFREDLYHRLAVLTFHLPPLRDRGRDILLLAGHALARACADYGLPPKHLAPQAQARLLAYSWPGNIRELSNVIERAALLTEAPGVTEEGLDLGADRSIPLAIAPARPTAAAVTMDEAIRAHLRAALEQTGWNISRTAALLGISRNTLTARIQRFSLDATDGAGSRQRAERPRAAPRSPAAAAAGPIAASPASP